METNPSPQDLIEIYIQIINNSDYSFTVVDQDSSDNAPSPIAAHYTPPSFSEQSKWVDIVSNLKYQVTDDPTKVITMSWTISWASPNSASCSPTSGSPKVSVSNSSPSIGDTITFTITN